MATPPTVVEVTASSTFVNVTSPKSGASTFAVTTGDLVISGVVEENDDKDELYDWSDSAGQISWTEHATSNGANDADAYVATAQGSATGSSGTDTVTVTRTFGASGFWGAAWAHFLVGTHNGVGAIARTASTGTAPTLNITTTGDNSAIVVFAGDWAAGDGGSRVRKTVNGSTGVEIAYAFDSIHYTVYSWYYADAGAAGVKTVGLDTPAGGDFQIIAVEVLAVPTPTDPGSGRYLLEDGSGYYEMEGTTEDLLLDTAEVARPINVVTSNPALMRSFTR